MIYKILVSLFISCILVFSSGCTDIRGTGGGDSSTNSSIDESLNEESVADTSDGPGVGLGEDTDDTIVEDDDKVIEVEDCVEGPLKVEPDITEGVVASPGSVVSFKAISGSCFYKWSFVQNESEGSFVINNNGIVYTVGSEVKSGLDILKLDDGVESIIVNIIIE